ncbi:uncharacterized protein LOC125501504 [Athalia rosae]|uniref:uncharacterized protein LOC125501504 n=1 Tax=Athalia rosae TaxID=37344 RepID=UPI002033D458|nr:uncharacterized protein LOC125501504 [Athalia rosae]
MHIFRHFSDGAAQMKLRTQFSKVIRGRSYNSPDRLEVPVHRGGYSNDKRAGEQSLDVSTFGNASPRRHKVYVVGSLGVRQEAPIRHGSKGTPVVRRPLVKKTHRVHNVSISSRCSEVRGSPYFPVFSTM